MPARDENREIIDRRPQAGGMVCFADAVWNVVRRDRHSGSLFCRIERLRHRHCGGKGRIARLEFDGLLDAAARDQLKKVSLRDIARVSRLA